MSLQKSEVIYLRVRQWKKNPATEYGEASEEVPSLADRRNAMDPLKMCDGDIRVKKTFSLRFDYWCPPRML